MTDSVVDTSPRYDAKFVVGVTDIALLDVVDPLEYLSVVPFTISNKSVVVSGAFIEAVTISSTQYMIDAVVVLVIFETELTLL